MVKHFTEEICKRIRKLTNILVEMVPGHPYAIILKALKANQKFLNKPLINGLIVFRGNSYFLYVDADLIFKDMPRFIREVFNNTEEGSGWRMLPGNSQTLSDAIGKLFQFCSCPASLVLRDGMIIPEPTTPMPTDEEAPPFEIKPQPEEPEQEPGPDDAFSI